MAKVSKLDYEKTYGESDKRIKRSSSSLSSDEDDAKHEVSVQESTRKCNICGKTFKNGQALGGHKRSHLQKIKLETPSSPEISPNTYEESEKRMQKSSFSLSSDKDDDKHEVSILSSTHNCNICGKTFKNGQALGGHKRSHPLKKIKLETPSSPNTYEESEKSSSSLSSDEDDAKHECNICGKTFTNGKALGGHRRSHFIKKKLNHPANHVSHKSFWSNNYKSPTEHHKEDQACGNFSLPKWQKKDRRGRKCIGSVEAAVNLLHLRSDKYFCVGESSSNGNGKNELGGDRNSSDEQLKKGIRLFDLNESYAIED